MTWQANAACRGADTGLFFPVGDHGLQPDYRPALAICAGCPVMDDCREASAREPFGVWGGTVPEERGFHNGQRNTAKVERELRKLRKVGLVA